MISSIEARCVRRVDGKRVLLVSGVLTSSSDVVSYRVCGASVELYLSSQGLNCAMGSFSEEIELDSGFSECVVSVEAQYGLRVPHVRVAL